MVPDVMPDHTGSSDEPDAPSPETARSVETSAPVSAARAADSVGPGASRRYPEHRPTAAGFAGMLSHQSATPAQIAGEAPAWRPARKAPARRSRTAAPASAVPASAAIGSAPIRSASVGDETAPDSTSMAGGPTTGAIRLNHHASRRADAALPSHPTPPGAGHTTGDLQVEPQADLSTITGPVHLPARKGGQVSPRSSVYHAAIEQAAQERKLDHQLHPRVDHTRTRAGVARAPRADSTGSDDDLVSAEPDDDLASSESVDDLVSSEIAQTETAPGGFKRASDSVVLAESPPMSFAPDQQLPHHALAHDPSHTGIHGGVADIALIESTMEAARSSVEPVITSHPTRRRRLIVTILGVVVVALVIVGLALAAQLLPRGDASGGAPTVAPSSTPTVGPSDALDPNSPVPVQTMTPAPTNSPVFEIPAATP